MVEEEHQEGHVPPGVDGQALLSVSALFLSLFPAFPAAQREVSDGVSSDTGSSVQHIHYN